jgi:hypothetical protein
MQQDFSVSMLTRAQILTLAQYLLASCRLRSGLQQEMIGGFKSRQARRVRAQTSDA